MTVGILAEIRTGHTLEARQKPCRWIKLVWYAHSLIEFNCTETGLWCNTKGKFHHITCHEGTQVEWRYICTLSLTSGLDGVMVNATPRSGRFTPREWPITHSVGGWVGPRVGVDACWKSRPPPGFHSGTVQPVVSRYTDWAISVRGVM